MVKCSTNQNVVFEIKQDTFPISGIDRVTNLRQQNLIQEERRIAAYDLYEQPQNISIEYEYNFNSEPDKYGDYPENVNPEKVLIRQENKTITFEAMAEVSVPEKLGSFQYIPHPDTPIITIANASLNKSKLLFVAKEYLRFQKDTSDILKDFAIAGNIEGIEKLDEERKLFHGDVNKIIDAELKGQNITMSADFNFRTMRYLSAALVIHLLPASAFEVKEFTEETVGARYNGGNELPNSSKVWGRTNPFEYSNI